MVLALSYMKKTQTADPETQERFLEKIDVGYRRLLTFEVKEEPGGFDWWGKAPANLFLTAYGLMEFRNLSDVYPVDAALLPRIVAWLKSRQKDDGSWSPEGIRTGWSTDMAKGQSFYLTAYVAWGLARAGLPDAKALAWLEENGAGVDDPYGLALAALAFLTAAPDSAAGRAVVDRLVALQARDAGGPHWIPEQATGIGARGNSAAIETTALAIQALLLDGRHGGLAYRAIDRLVQWREADGRFGTTQSTILALEALVAADSGQPPKDARTVRIAAGEVDLASVALPPDSTEPRRVDLPPEATDLRVVLEGDGRVRTTLSTTAWLPWERAPGSTGPLALTVRHPQDVLAVGTKYATQVEIANTSDEQSASVVTIEVGVPPGCTVEPEDVEGEGAENVERAETAIVIYLRDLAPGQKRAFRVVFTPRYGLDVWTAPSKAYEYYVPEEEVVVAPQRVRAAR